MADPRQATIEVCVLGYETFEQWCVGCLFTTMWVRLYIQIGDDAQTLRRCMQGEHDDD